MEKLIKSFREANSQTDAIYCLANEILSLVYSSNRDQIDAKLSTFVRDNIANWQDFSVAQLMRFILGGRLGEDFHFENESWIAEETGKTNWTVD